jgi:hypothetical protein
MHANSCMIIIKLDRFLINGSLQKYLQWSQQAQKKPGMFRNYSSKSISTGPVAFQSLKVALCVDLHRAANVKSAENDQLAVCPSARCICFPKKNH